MIIIDDINLKAVWNYQATDFKSLIRAVVSDATLAMILFRLMSCLDKFIFTKPIAAFICKLNAIICGAVIGRGAQFSNGFVILHSVGIVINSTVIGGKNIIIESGVVIGADKRKTPALGNNIFIGSGAKIFGGITIGDNVIIGANAVVNKDVPSNVTVAGVPAKVVKINNISFFENILNKDGLVKS